MKTKVTTSKITKPASSYNSLLTFPHVNLTVQCYHRDYIIRFREMDSRSHCKYIKKKELLTFESSKQCKEQIANTKAGTMYEQFMKQCIQN